MSQSLGLLERALWPCRVSDSEAPRSNKPKGSLEQPLQNFQHEMELLPIFSPLSISILFETEKPLHDPMLAACHASEQGLSAVMWQTPSGPLTIIVRRPTQRIPIQIKNFDHGTFFFITFRNIN